MHHRFLSVITLVLLFVRIGVALPPDSSIVKKFAVPVGLVTAGLLTQGDFSEKIRNRVVNTYPNFNSHADGSLQFAPLVVSLGLNVVGVKGKHKLGDALILAGISNVIAQGITQTTKRIIEYPRPDGSENDAFPSGHTTMAFTSASILHEEYGGSSRPWVSVLAYGTATTVGAFRILNNRHWFADVLAGAGVGIGATKLTYAVYPWLKKRVFKRDNLVVLPTYNGQTTGLYGCVRF